MPKYLFTGDNPAILVGLSQGVNAEHIPADNNPEVEEGATIVAAFGDEINTGDDEYISAFLQEAPKPADKAKSPKPESNDTSKES